jgi:hypothetical protein
VASLGVHPHQEVGLVLHALVRKELRAFVGHAGLWPLAERHLPREHGAMLAVDVVVQVRRRKKKTTVAALHAEV